MPMIHNEYTAKFGMIFSVEWVEACLRCRGIEISREKIADVMGRQRSHLTRLITDAAEEILCSAVQEGR